MIEKPGDLAGLLTNLEKNDVLFIDEIHRLSPVVEEYLYSAMEDFIIDIVFLAGILHPSGGVHPGILRRRRKAPVRVDST